jgi:hypothetical protein
MSHVFVIVGHCEQRDSFYCNDLVKGVLKNTVKPWRIKDCLQAAFSRKH